MKTILVIDDEQYLRELYEAELTQEGFNVLLAKDGFEGISLCEQNDPDLVIVDIRMPGMDGLEICKRVRRDDEISETPIIMLSAKGEEFDRVLGFELGADDYLAKPFSVRELMARIRAILRRSTIRQTSDTMTFDDITIDFDKHIVLKNGSRLDFTLKEFEFLELLVKNKGKVITREAILEKIWGYEYLTETRTVDVHVRHIRQKIEKDDKNPRHIETLRGIGYRFNLNG